MRFVIVTGMSGGGKSTAMRLLEDMGFYCVDNLPVELIDKFMELLTTPNTEISKVALGVDVRTDQSFLKTEKILRMLRQNGMVFEVLFMDASDSVLLKRYKESRRVHPLCTGETIRLEQGIAKEREILRQVKKDADYVIDTSKMLTRELKAELDRIFLKNEEYNSLIINILSFGFKHGILADADLVFDVRFLPNPFYIDELKYLTGNDRGVQDYVMSFPEAEVFLDKLTDLLDFLIPNYIKEGKYQLVIGIGCTGGKHRSVTLANELYRRLKNHGAGYGVTLNHRDI
ncbi:MAG: RNase adapter RapZ [Lachnospiraceae bacterium]|nr:RNase adapter RapZ [Lachnospiraceae bacterium]